MHGIPWEWYVTTLLKVAALAVCCRFRRVSPFMPALIFGLGLILLIAIVPNAFAITDFWHSDLGRGAWNVYARVVSSWLVLGQISVIAGLFLVLGDQRGGSPRTIDSTTQFASDEDVCEVDS